MSPQFNSKHSSIQKAPKLLLLKLILLKSNYINQCYVNCIDWSIAYPPTQFCFVSNGTYKELFGLFHSFAQRGWDRQWRQDIVHNSDEVLSFKSLWSWGWQCNAFLKSCWILPLGELGHRWKSPGHQLMDRVQCFRSERFTQIVQSKAILREADRMEIRKFYGRTTDGHTGVGARDTY